METITIILLAALAVSEALSLIPAVKSNSIFQAITNIIKHLARPTISKTPKNVG